MSEKVKLVVCNEPQNCETVKELESRLAEALPDAEKWRFLHLEAEEPLSCQMCRNAHDAVLRKLDSTESRLRAASELAEELVLTPMPPKPQGSAFQLGLRMAGQNLKAALRGEAQSASTQKEEVKT